MAMEMICGLCRGVMLVEQVGVVVECPHCGGHVRVPGPEEDASPPPRAPSSPPRSKSSSSSAPQSSKPKQKTVQPESRSVRPPDAPQPTSSQPKSPVSKPDQPSSKRRDPIPPPVDSNPFPFFESHEQPSSQEPLAADDHPFLLFGAAEAPAAPASKPTKTISNQSASKPPAPQSTSPPREVRKPDAAKPNVAKSEKRDVAPPPSPSPVKTKIEKPKNNPLQTAVDSPPLFPLFSDVEPLAATSPVPEPKVVAETPAVEAPVDFSILFGHAEPEAEPVPLTVFEQSATQNPKSPGELEGVRPRTMSLVRELTPTGSTEKVPLADHFGSADSDSADAPISVKESPAAELSDTSANVLDEAPDESHSASQVFGDMFGEQSSPEETFAPAEPAVDEAPLTSEPDSVSNPLDQMFAPSSDTVPAEDREPHEFVAAVEVPSFESIEPDKPEPIAAAIVEPEKSDDLPIQNEMSAELEVAPTSDAAPDFFQFIGADADKITSDSDVDQPIVSNESDDVENAASPQLLDDPIADSEDAPQLVDDADEDSLFGTQSQGIESLSGTVGTESQPTLPEDSLSVAMLASMTAGLPSEVTEPPRDSLEASNEAEVIAFDSEQLREPYADVDPTTPDFTALDDQPESPMPVETPTTALADEVSVADEPVLSHFDDLASDESSIPDSLTETFHEDEPQVLGDSEPDDETSAKAVAAPVSTIAPKRDVDGYVWISKGKLTMLMAYAAAITLGFVMVLFRFLQAGGAGGGGSSGGDLESLPDLSPPKTKNGKQVQFILIPPDADMPAGHDLKIGDSQRFGNIQVTVQKVTRGPLKFTHFKQPGKERLPTAPTLKLWLKFENVSKDQEIAPLDAGLLFSRSGKNRLDWRGNQFVCRAANKPKKSGQRVLAYDHPFKDEWDLVNLPLGKPLKPGESREMYVPTSENDLDELTGDLIWRVHFRKGFGPKGRGVTTVFEVRFESVAITDEAV